ncbi:MAG: EAL domain-containing protein [Clostridiales bacterium]|nr:EAL domain-containing protein [Clostridiales bacterium]
MALAAGFDVCVFTMYQKYQDSIQRETGDSSIFNVINYDKFDAVVVMADSIQTPGVVERIENALNDHYRGKVLFIEAETDKYPVELQDNYYPIKKLISHLIEEHNYKDIAYITGKSWHPHSKKRLQAFLDTMKEHGLEVDEKSRVFYGDFWYSSGESVVEKLTKKNMLLPQAIACANDAMALGVAKALTAKGFKIPEDIAVIGYDSNDEGKHAPVPLTSADLPLYAFGEHSAQDIINMLDGKEPTEFVSDTDLFIGKTCGCDGDSIKPDYPLRDIWDTQLSDSGVYSVFNHMSEDLISQANLTGLVNTIFSYVYQIRPFESFSLCLNSEWKRKNDIFSNEMIEVIRCGSGGNKDSVNFDITFNKELILPLLYEECDKPRVFYFMPFTFDDRLFGYTALAYTDPAKCVDDNFRIWARKAMMGFEVLRRADEALREEKRVQDVLMRDTLTGLLNYQGIVEEGEYILGLMHNRGGYVSALAIDVKDLSLINEQFGRSCGDKTLINTAGILESVFNDNGSICACLGNGEFVAVKVSSVPDESEMLASYDAMKEKLTSYNLDPTTVAKIFLYYGIEIGRPQTVTDLERLINTAISKKNGNKLSVGKAQSADMSDEEKEKSLIVNEIIESNRLNYHFQPIVKTMDGEIFAYEALMRADINPYIDPPTILKFAEMSDRLSEVEYETLSNVVGIVEQRKDIFDGTRKVFINSIPGTKVPEDKEEDISNRIKALRGSVVIELTEQSELTDDELADLKALYAKTGVETAVDDYGTGYSNVTNLLRYMPRYVKIDRMLLTNIQDSPQKQHFVKDIITFSHDNGIITLAEGVETTEELNTVIMLGVDLIQGYYTARPSAEIIRSIDQKVKQEICEYRMKYEESNLDSVFVAGREARIMLNNLNEQGVEVISVSRKEATFIDFTVTGSPELMTGMVMNITNGYKGRITLDNVGIGREKEVPAISIDGESDVTLVIKGGNTLMSGIYVAPNSVLHIEGDGDLTFNVSGYQFFCIGAGMDKKHGDIIIDDYDGALSVTGNGSTGVGIGSGLGGNIIINSANFTISVPGRSTVGIGNMTGESDIRINDCQISLYAKCMAHTGIGSQDGYADISVTNSSINSSIDGRDAMLMGSFDMRARPEVRGCTIISDIKSTLIKQQSMVTDCLSFLNGTFEVDDEGKIIQA